MSNKINQRVLIFSFFFLLLNNTASFPSTHISPKGAYTVWLTDTQKIWLLIDLIRQGIKQQKAEKIIEIIAPDFVVGDKKLGKEELKGHLRDLFVDSQQRTNTLRFKELKPVNMEVTSTWDFEISDVKIHLQEDTARVDCNLLFWASGPDLEDKSFSLGRRVGEKFLFSKKDHVWKLIRADKLFKFLEDYGEDSLLKKDKEASIDGQFERKERRAR